MGQLAPLPDLPELLLPAGEGGMKVGMKVGGLYLVRAVDHTHGMGDFPPDADTVVVVTVGRFEGFTTRHGIRCAIFHGDWAEGNSTPGDYVYNVVVAVAIFDARRLDIVDELPLGPPGST